METVVIIGVLMLVTSVICYIVSSVWFVLRWSMGWRPRILDNEVVDFTVGECVESAMEQDVRDAEEEYDHTMSEEEIQEHRERVEKAFRMAIERYIFNFSMKV